MARHQMRGAHSGRNAMQEGRSVREKALSVARRQGWGSVRGTKWQLQGRALDEGGYYKAKRRSGQDQGAHSVRKQHRHVRRYAASDRSAEDLTPQTYARLTGWRAGALETERSEPS